MMQGPKGEQITLEFTLGLTRASRDAVVKGALEEPGVMTAILRRFGDADDENLAFRGIAEMAVREAEKLRALRRDLSRRQFSQRERELLEGHPRGQMLLARMVDGDESAVTPSVELLAEIRRARADLGVT